MLNALLETIAILGILVSLAAKFGKPPLDAMAVSVEGEIIDTLLSPQFLPRVEIALHRVRARKAPRLQRTIRRRIMMSSRGNPSVRSGALLNGCECPHMGR